MKNLICKIACTFFLTVLLTALVGVNVRQLYCMHQHRTVWQLCMVPVSGTNPASDCCGQGCCGQGCCGGGCCEGYGCARQVQVLFYRLADCPEVETEIRVDVVRGLEAELRSYTPVPLRAEGKVCLPLVREVPHMPPDPSLLCVYRC